MLQGRGGGGARGGLQGARPGQNSTASLEQIVDIPVPRGLPDYLPRQGSASSWSRLHDDADEDFTWVFRTFPRSKKVRRWARTRGRNCSPSPAHPRGELVRTAMLLGDPRRLRGLLDVQFLDTVFDMPFVVYVRVVDVFFVQFIDGVDVPVLIQRRIFSLGHSRSHAHCVQ